MEDIIEGYIAEYEELFGKNILETIDNISDNQVQSFASRWNYFIDRSINVTFRIDNTRLINTKRGVATFLEHEYIRSINKLSKQYKIIGE